MVMFLFEHDMNIAVVVQKYMAQEPLNVDDYLIRF